jgi:hypothetical protein
MYVFNVFMIATLGNNFVNIKTPQRYLIRIFHLRAKLKRKEQWRQVSSGLLLLKKGARGFSDGAQSPSSSQAPFGQMDTPKSANAA